jgi:hypothetical protein
MTFWQRVGVVDLFIALFNGIAATQAHRGFIIQIIISAIFFVLGILNLLGKK